MKRFSLVVLCVLMLLAIPVANAEEAAIHNVWITVNLAPNGDAQIVEQWDVTVVSGTEWYLSMDNMDGMSIYDFSVQDETGTVYTFVDPWDLDRTIEEKAFTCGVVYDGGADYELCWGVGSYGRHTFTISYTIAGLVKRYEDGIGFVHTFLTKGLTAPVEQAVVNIACPGYTLDETNSGIWAFGYEGSIWFNEGGILAYNERRMETSEGMILMAELPGDYFTDAPLGAGSFDVIREHALSGSDYGEDGSESQDIGAWITVGVVLALVVLLIVYGSLKASLPDVFYRAHYGQSRQEMKNGAAEYSNYPFDGDLRKLIAMLTFLGNPPTIPAIVNAYILKWMKEGALARPAEGQQQDSLYFTKATHGDSAPEAQLYAMLFMQARGGELTVKAIEEWAYGSQTAIEAWRRRHQEMALAALRGDMLLTKERVRRSFVSGNIEVLNDRGWECAKQVYGFKQYLLRCSVTQGAIPDDYVNDYLAYADLYNIFGQMSDGYGYRDDYINDYYTYYYVNRAFHRAYSRGETRYSNEHRSSGGGGSSSSGGGGGSSGGGGGGSR